MISSKEIKVLDVNSEYYGVPAINLMENAGKNVAEYIQKNIENKKKILIFCGTGNNGGDGFVAARHLSKSFEISLFLTGNNDDIKTKISKKNFDLLFKEKIQIHNIEHISKINQLINENDVIIDSMLGIGLSGCLREPYNDIVKKINNAKNKKLISVDVPTGFGTRLSIRPDITITFHDIKTGMNKKKCGLIKTVDIGIPKKAVEYIGPGELITFYRKSKEDSHKGENGRVLIVGGGPYIGAPALSGLSSLRVGSDLVYIATPKRAARAITSFSPSLLKPIKQAKEIARKSPNLIVKELKNEDYLDLDDLAIIEDIISKIDTLVIGPGLGSKESTKSVIEEIIHSCIINKKSIVVDADAISVVGKNQSLIKNSNTVVTPHMGEFKELTGVIPSKKLSIDKKNIKEWAKKLGVTILLKGQIDIISNGYETKLNDIHNPAMTVGGTGDVLAGIIGGLLSKNIETFNSARIGAFINGSAGNIAFEKYSYGLIATDIIDEIPKILKKYL